MPGELILDAREDMARAVTAAGYDYIMMDETATRYGAVKPGTKDGYMRRGLKRRRVNMMVLFFYAYFCG